ncbi:MAG: HlyD family efflux transporter periplasmic adaptor subunit [Desulfobacteraceae bacterium]|nr:HlyD family efflux transporter periplasmic adaptor subunit [Desulfobacteraceae bacterium]
MEKVLQTWLFHQCRKMSGSIHAMLLTNPSDEGPDKRVLFWPDNLRDHTRLSRVARTALRTGQPVIKSHDNEMEKTGEPLDALACPLFLKGRLFGAVAVEMTNRSKPMQETTVCQLKAGAEWLEAMILLHGSTAKDQLVNLVDLVASGLEHDRFRLAASEVTNELAQRFSCRRVSIGFLRYNIVRVEALSHCSRIDQHSSLVRAIRDAMSEALDQCATVVYPPEPNAPPVATRFHAQLAKEQHGTAICTLPLIRNNKAVGALLLERAGENPFPPETVVQCEQIGLLLGPVLETRRRDERPLHSKILESLRTGLVKLFGPRHLTLKAAVSLGAILLAWLSLATAMFRISCDSVLEPGVCQVIVAPQQGYIAKAHARAGDLVQAGDLLATLDDQDLRLEQRKWQSKRARLLKEYRKALAGFNRAEVAILKAKRAQAEAQLALTEKQLARTTLVAPFSGLVVKGDLSQALGSPVTRGEVLYEVAPTGQYLVVLKVEDRDIGLVSPGQKGKLKLSGIPDQTISITIDRLTPVSTPGEGRNYFRVEAVMEKHSDLMRPGMEGISKIEIGREKLLRIWTRPWSERLRILAWKLLP